MKNKKRGMSITAKQKAAGWSYLAPATILILIMSFWPIIQAVITSFKTGSSANMQWANPITYNYTRMLQDNVFKRSVGNTFLYLIIEVPIMLVLAILLAQLLNNKDLKFKGFFRTCVFLPCATSLVSYALIFKSLFATQGLMNTILVKLGILQSNFNFLGTAWSAKIIIIVALIWRWTGYNMVFFLAGLQNIEYSVYEAAKIDVSLEATDEAAVEAEQSEINQEMKKALPAEAKYLYKYLCVNPAGAQIVNVLQTMKVDPKRSKNLVILGLHGFGSAKIGEDFAECYYDLGFCTSPAKAKVKAKVINSGKLAGAVTKLKGGCLIVESAGLITPERFKEMVDLCSTEKNDVKVILTGEKVALSKMLADNMTQARSFNNRVYFDQIKEENMIVIAKEYIIEKGYKYEDGIDGNIKNVLMAMESGNIDRLLTAIDEAIERADARNAEAKKVMKTDIK